MTRLLPYSSLASTLAALLKFNQLTVGYLLGILKLVYPKPGPVVGRTTMR